MIILEDSLTNPQILIGTPPPFEPPQRPPEQVLSGYWYFERQVRPLPEDHCEALAEKALEFNTFLQFFVRCLTDDDEVSKFDAKLQAGMREDLDSRIDLMPTGTFIRATGSLISTPYHGTDRRFYRNLIKDHPENTNEQTVVYFWEVETEDERKYVHPRDDGSISVTPRGRRDAQARRIGLPVVGNEQSKLDEYSSYYSNDEVNAFTLVVGIEPGPEHNSSGVAHTKPIPWKITINFGEVELVLEEGRSEAKATVAGRTEMITINPGASSKTRTDAGLRSYELTFIPVWNGILFSDSSPSSSSWEDRCVFIRKTLNRTIFRDYETEFHKLTDPNEPVIPRFGENGQLLPIPGSLGEFTPSGADDPFFLANTIGKKGCQLTPSVITKVNTGANLLVEFERCGGTLRFVPVFFSRCVRSYLFMRGERSTKEDRGKTCPDWPEVPHRYVVPVYSYAGADLASNLPYMWIQDQEDAAHVLAYESERELPGYRRPFEIWGYVIVISQNYEEGAPVDQDDQELDEEDFPDEDTEIPEEDEDLPDDILNPEVEGSVQSLQFRTGEGELTAEDLPVDRIRRISVTRSLEGSSGQIEWDRFDPDMGLVERPAFRVGSVRIAVTGGSEHYPRGDLYGHCYGQPGD